MEISISAKRMLAHSKFYGGSIFVFCQKAWSKGGAVPLLDMKLPMSQEPHIAFVIDDDLSVREGLSNLLRSVDIAVETFGSTADFLQSKRPDIPACLILDVRLPGTSGLEFQEDLGKRGVSMPIIFCSSAVNSTDTGP